MRIYVYILMISICLCGCATVALNHITPTPPKYTDYCHGNICDDVGYANELNWYMIYIYSYTKAYNEYAETQGWKPNKDMRPVCRLVEWPTATPFPPFDPSKYDSSITDFEWKLTQYIKKLRSIYNEHREHLSNLSYIQHEMCTY